MYGLLMIKDYLVELLDGSKTYDARAYATNKRGTIALVDTKSSKIYGLVDLVDVHEISAEEYCKWHCTGKYSKASFDIKALNGKNCYAWNFKNPRVLATPIKVDKGSSRTWIEFDESKVQFVFQNKLF